MTNTPTPEANATTGTTEDELAYARHLSQIETAAAELTGLCELLYAQTAEMCASPELHNATHIDFSYKCLARLATKLADDISEIAS